jgi:hypothetical protein
MDAPWTVNAASVDPIVHPGEPNLFRNESNWDGAYLAELVSRPLLVALVAPG